MSILKRLFLVFFRDSGWVEWGEYKSRDIMHTFHVLHIAMYTHNTVIAYWMSNSYTAVQMRTYLQLLHIYVGGCSCIRPC